jgi:hypothetical protein
MLWPWQVAHIAWVLENNIYGKSYNKERLLGKLTEVKEWGKKQRGAWW